MFCACISCVSIMNEIFKEDLHMNNSSGKNVNTLLWADVKSFIYTAQVSISSGKKTHLHKDTHTCLAMFSTELLTRFPVLVTDCL